MSQAQQPQKLIIQPANYPVQLLLSDVATEMIFNAGNYSPADETYKIVFSGNGLNVSIPDELNQPVPFKIGETKQFSLKFTPTVTGITSLSVEYSSYERTVTKELVWKVKDQISQKEIEKINSASTIAVKDLTQYSNVSPNLDLAAEGLQPHPLEEVDTYVNSLYQQTEPPLSKAELEGKLVGLIKSIFNENHSKALDLLSSISDFKTKDSLISHLMPALIKRDQQAGINLIFTIFNESVRNSTTEHAAYVLFHVNAQDAVMLAMNISDIKYRDSVLVNLINALKTSNSELAANIVFQISDEKLQKSVLFEVIKTMSVTDKTKAIESLTSLVMNTLAGPNIDFIKNCIIFLGYLTSPQSVLDLIEKLDQSERDFLNSELKGLLKFQTEEDIVRIVETPIGSLSFNFIAYVGAASNELTYLSKLMGNIDPSLLTGKINSSYVVLQPYYLQFPLLYSVFNANNQLVSSGKPGFHYILFPATQGLNSEEWAVLSNILNKYVVPINFQNTAEKKGVLFVLDCIGFTDKPMIILSENPESQRIASKLQSSMKGVCQIEINNEFFGDGIFNQELVKMIQNRPISVVNLTLSINFFNDPTLLYTFFNSLT